MFICNKCKRVFPDLDGYGLRTQFRFGYGSKYDGDLFDMTICNDCADSVAEALVNLCAVSPIVRFDDSLLYGDDDDDTTDEEDLFPDDCSGGSPLFS